MLGLLVRVIGGGSLASKFMRATRHIPSELEKAVLKSAYLVQRSAKQNLTGGNPLYVRSGLLRSSVTVDHRGLEARVGTNVRYGAIHEKGHTIITSGLMVFDIRGRIIRTRKVTIPRRPWLVPAFERNRDKIVGMMDKSVQMMIKREGL